jgi:hypothetical protein
LCSRCQPHTTFLFLNSNSICKKLTLLPTLSLVKGINFFSS